MQINTLFNNNEEITLETYLNKCGVENVSKYLKCNTVEDDNNYININRGKEIVNRYLNENKDIYLLADCDCDGFMSASMVYTFIKRTTSQSNIKLLVHDGKEHGLADKKIFKMLKESEPSLLWIPDAGSSNMEQIEALYDLGYDIVITDHHEFPIEYLNSDKCCIINNQDGSVKNKNGSGGLVTWHLLHSLNKDIANDLISYVAISLIGDSMSMLSNENYTFAKRGKDMVHSNLLSITNDFNKGDTNKDYSFGCISKINATIRLGTEEDKIKLFKCLCGEVTDTETFKNLHKQQVDECKRLTDKLIENIDDSKNYILLKINEKTTLTGLVANKIRGMYNKPTFLLHHRKTGEVAGSVRSEINGLRDILNESGLFNYNEGHDNVFGTSYQYDNEDKVLEYLDNIFSHLQPQIDVLNSYSIKCIPNELYSLISAENGLNLWGQDISAPVIHIKPFKINGRDIESLGNGTTLKVKQNGFTIMFFFMSKDKSEKLHVGENIDFNLELVGELNINEWKGYKTNQIIVTNYEVTELNNDWTDLF